MAIAQKDHDLSSMLQSCSKVRILILRVYLLGQRIAMYHISISKTLSIGSVL